MTKWKIAMRWLKKRKLVSLIERLAMYNDKGVEWRKHSESQSEEVREKMLAKIRIAVNELGIKNIPEALLLPIQSGSIKSDSSGRFVGYAKSVS